MKDKREKPCHTCSYKYSLCSVCGCNDTNYEDTPDGEMEFFKEIRYSAWVIDGNLFQASEVEKEEDIGAEWLDTESISIGKSHGNTPDIYYLVAKNHEPYLLVEVYYDYTVYTPAHTLWYNYLLIKRFQDFYYIDLLTLTAERFPVNGKIDWGCVDEFYRLTDRLLITSLSRIYCFDKILALLWVSGEVACDCTLISGYKNGYLFARGDDDPPGGWVKCKVDFATGKVKDREWDVSEDYAGLKKDLEEDPQFILDQIFGTSKKKSKRKK